MSKFMLTSTHTFQQQDLDGSIYADAGLAWVSAALDWSRSDHGNLMPSVQEKEANIMWTFHEAGIFTTRDGVSLIVTELNQDWLNQKHDEALLVKDECDMCLAEPGEPCRWNCLGIEEPTWADRQEHEAVVY